jgi:hypothetical protein
MDLSKRFPPWPKLGGFQKLATGLTFPTLPSPSLINFDLIRRQEVRRQGELFYGTTQAEVDTGVDDAGNLGAEAVDSLC